MRGVVILFLLAATIPYSPPYARDPRVHSLGMFGFKGHAHALLAPIAEKVIDVLAYESESPRAELHELIQSNGNDKVVDLGCGTGGSTPVNGIGVDSSPSMLKVARLRAGNLNKTFVLADAESYGDALQFDAAIISFLLHEVPPMGRENILRNALRIAFEVYIIDIARNYTPSPLMLTGEPYLLGFLDDLSSEIGRLSKEEGLSVSHRRIGKGRVDMYHLSRDAMWDDDRFII